MHHKYIRYILPNIEKIKTKKGFSILGLWMEKRPYLFSLQRKKIALGFSIGIGIGILPIPFQIFLSIFVCYLLRANIPSTILAAFIINPIVYPFVLMLSLHVGSVITDTDFNTFKIPSFSSMFSHYHLWYTQMKIFLKQTGVVLFTGTSILSILSSFFSYWLIRIFWFLSVCIQLQKRKNKIRYHKS